MIELAGADSAASGQAALGRPSLMVVAHQPSVVLTVHQLFKHDYQVVASRSGQEALLRCQQQLPDLILLAAALPDMSGFDVCQQIMADSALRDVPVLLLADAGSPEDALRGLRLGAQDFVPLPIVPEVMTARVRTHLAGKLQRDMLRGLAYRDGLTGISNRRRFDLEFPRIWSFCQRTRSSLAFGLVDLDCFKLFNDCYGHQAGDRCLAAVAQVLAVAARRPHDLVARFGGEEFAVLLPGCNAEAAAAAAQRLGSAIEGLAIEHRSSLVAPHVTVSCGMAVGVPDERVKPQALLALADQQLSLAKRAGRARTCVAQLGVL
ncbi:MAG TPA: diguanylate cyclase [Pseudoduganella sp.]